MGRWIFLVGLLSVVICWVLDVFNHWGPGLNTINGYDPTPAVFLVPLGIILLSYAVGAPLARKGWISGLFLQRWVFLAGIAMYVAAYAAALLVHPQFNPTTGAGFLPSGFPSSVLLACVILLLSEVFVHETTPLPPPPILGPGGVPVEVPHPDVTAKPPPSATFARTRLRRLDGIVMVAAVVALAMVFVFWTGYGPAFYGPPSSEWTLEYVGCGPGANTHTLPYIEPTFPLWARVHMTWWATALAYVDVWGLGGPDYSAGGMSGWFSFVSNDRPLVLDVSPFGAAGCSNVSLYVYANYTV